MNGLTWGWKPTASSGTTITGSTTGSSTVQVKLFTSFQQQNKIAILATAPYICVLGDIEQLQVYKYKKRQHPACQLQSSVEVWEELIYCENYICKRI